MKKENKTKKQLLEEIEDLRIRLEEAEETLRTIRSDGVDALIVSGPQVDQVFTLTGAERAYRVFIETMNEGAVSLNQEGMIIYCNQRFAEMLETPLEKVIGAPIRQFIRAADLPVFDSLIENGAQENGKGEIAFIHTDGAVMPVLLSISALQNDNANIYGITITDLTAQKHIEEELRRHRDNLEELVKDRTSELEISNQQLLKEITERRRSNEALRKSESEFRLLAEAMPQIVWVTRPDGWNIYFNQKWVEYTGLLLEESYGHGWNKPFHPDDQQQAWDAWHNATKHGTVYSLESRLRRADGVYKWWLIRGVPVLDEQGAVLKWFGTCTDIDDMKQAEEEIRRLNADLEQRVTERTAQLESANKELEAFAYSVSHDLRAPLRAIDGYSRFVLEDYSEKLDDEGKRLLNIIRTNTQKMDQLIVDILELSRASRTEMEFSRIDMTTLVNSIYRETASPEIQEKFVFSVSQLPDTFGDITLIRQVWTNLISNAIKYTLPKEDRRIEIGSRVESDMNMYYVKDTGVGYNPDYANKLFGLFQRLHKAEEFEGTGVGLAIVKRIILRHSGKVWAEGKVNEGATFWFSIPKDRQ